MAMPNHATTALGAIGVQGCSTNDQVEGVQQPFNHGAEDGTMSATAGSNRLKGLHLMKYLWKTSDCQTTDCPALLETDEHYYVVGVTPTDAEYAEVLAAAQASGSGIGEGEAVLRLPKDILNRLKTA